MTSLVKAISNSAIDFTFVQLTSQTDRMQGMLRQVYNSAAGPDSIRKFELRDLREILQQAGGQADANMLSAAGTPSIRASYTSTVTGTPCLSPSVQASYMEYAGRGVGSVAAANVPRSMPARVSA